MKPHDSTKFTNTADTQKRKRIQAYCDEKLWKHKDDKRQKEICNT